MFSVEGRLVDKDQAAWLAAPPGLALLGQVSACAIRRHQLFLYVNPARHKRRDKEAL